MEFMSEQIIVTTEQNYKMSFSLLNKTKRLLFFVGADSILLQHFVLYLKGLS